MEKFKALKGRVIYYVFPGKTKPADAVRQANAKIKTSEHLLSVRTGYVWEGQLFWDKPHAKAKAVIAVWRG